MSRTAGGDGDERSSPTGPTLDRRAPFEQRWRLGGRRYGHLLDGLRDPRARPPEEVERHRERGLEPIDPFPPLRDPEHAAAERLQVDGPVEGGRRIERRAVAHELDADQRPRRADVPDLLEPLHERIEL